MIRTFIALPVILPAPLKRRSEELQLQFSQERFRWVAAGRMHITLRFLGNLGEDHVERVSVLLGKAFEGAAGGEIVLCGLGTFANRSDLTVLWAGVKDHSWLQELRTRVDRALEPMFPVKEERYIPHLTLARMKSTTARIAFQRELKEEHDTAFGSYRPDRIILYRSIIGTGAPEYVPLREYMLK